MAENRYGLNHWYPPPGRSDQDCILDICLLHGLNGSIGNTFTKKDNRPFRRTEPCVWPRDLLPDDIARTYDYRARILAFGFDANVLRLLGSHSHETIIRTANGLLAGLGDERRESYQEERPIMFIGHSLGGLVIKRLLRIAWDSDDPRGGLETRRRRRIAENARAVIFAGTPHRGANLAHPGSWALMMLKSFGLPTSTENVTELRLGSNTTDLLRQDFVVFRRKMREHVDSLPPPGRSDFKVYTFYETVNPIVSYDSATIDDELPQPMEGYGHQSMVKFAHRDESGYKMFLNAIRNVMDEVVQEYQHISAQPSSANDRTSEWVSRGQPQTFQWHVGTFAQPAEQQEPDLSSGSRSYDRSQMSAQWPAPTSGPRISLASSPDPGPVQQYLYPGDRAPPSELPGAPLESVFAQSPPSSSSRSPQSLSPEPRGWAAATLPLDGSSSQSRGLAHQRSSSSSSQDVRQLLIKANDARRHANRRHKIEAAAQSFRLALALSRQAREPNVCDQIDGHFGLVECAIDMSLTYALAAEAKLVHVGEAEYECEEALQLAREAEIPNLQRRGRAFKARLQARRAVLENMRRGADTREMRRQLQEAETQVRIMLRELEGDPESQREEDLLERLRLALAELQEALR